VDDLVEEAAPIEALLPDEPAILWGDSDRLLQVLTNLLDNAEKFSPSNEAIQVKLEPSSDAGWLLTVQDHGVGLPPGAHELIFEPFGRVVNPAARYVPGLGLGLSISRDIVHRHGGRLWAESAGEGLGTVFFVWLPTSPAGAETQQRK